MGTNNKQIEVGKQDAPRSATPQKVETSETPRITAPSNTSISRSGRRDLETQQRILNFVGLFSSSKLCLAKYGSYMQS